MAVYIGIDDTAGLLDGCEGAVQPRRSFQAVRRRAPLST